MVAAHRLVGDTRLDIQATRSMATLQMLIEPVCSSPTPNLPGPCVTKNGPHLSHNTKNCHQAIQQQQQGRNQGQRDRISRLTVHKLSATM
jgi:hypothetical protein